MCTLIFVFIFQPHIRCRTELSIVCELVTTQYLGRKSMKMCEHILEIKIKEPERTTHLIEVISNGCDALCHQVLV